MTKRYYCATCSTRLVPQYDGGPIARFLQHTTNDCPSSGLQIKYGDASIVAKEEPVVMLETGLSYKNAGIKRFFQCNLDPKHVDYYRGEVSDIDRPDIKPWKRCITPGCNGRMDLRSVHLRLDGSIEPFVGYKRKPKMQLAEAVAAVIVDEPTLLRRFVRKFAKGKFRKVKLPNTTKRVELVEKGAVAYRRKGTAFSSKITVIADSETQSLTVALYGCAGWATQVKEAARKAHLPVTVVVRPSVKTERARKVK